MVVIVYQICLGSKHVNSGKQFPCRPWLRRTALCCRVASSATCSCRCACQARSRADRIGVASVAAPRTWRCSGPIVRSHGNRTCVRRHLDRGPHRLPRGENRPNVAACRGLPTTRQCQECLASTFRNQLRGRNAVQSAVGRGDRPARRFVHQAAADPRSWRPFASRQA